MKSRWIGFILVALTAVLMKESQAQIRQPMKVKLSVSPSINISRIDAGFSISAYENISVLVSVSTAKWKSDGKESVDAQRITCGFLNDGTTNFRRATITNKSDIQFRLRNNSLLKRSMKLTNPLFEAYVFFLINKPKEEKSNASPLPVATVTVEFM